MIDFHPNHQKLRQVPVVLNLPILYLQKHRLLEKTVQHSPKEGAHHTCTFSLILKFTQLKTIAGESTAHNFRASDACVFVKSYVPEARLSPTVTYCRTKHVYIHQTKVDQESISRNMPRKGLGRFMKAAERKRRDLCSKLLTDRHRNSAEATEILCVNNGGRDTIFPIYIQILHGDLSICWHF